MKKKRNNMWIFNKMPHKIKTKSVGDDKYVIPSLVVTFYKGFLIIMFIHKRQCTKFTLFALYINNMTLYTITYES